MIVTLCAIMYISRVVYRTSILYRTCMVWLFVPYAYNSYYTTIAVHEQHKYIAIANTVLLFVMNYTHDAASCSDVQFCADSDKFVITEWTIQIWPAPKVTSNWNDCYTERIIGNFKSNVRMPITINS